MDNRTRRSLRAQNAAQTGESAHPEPARAAITPGWRRTTALLTVVVALVGSVAFPSQAQTDDSTTTTTQPTTQPTTPSTLSAEDQARKARAAGNLNAAKAADTEIAAALQAINETAQATQSKIDRVERRLEVARATMSSTTEELAASNAEQDEIEAQLRAKAVEGFKAGHGDPGPLFSDQNFNQSLRQSQLLHHANKDTADLLEDLRALLEDRRVAQAEAIQATQDAAELEVELKAELENLKEQATVQLRLKGEAESRIAKWEAELTAYAAEDEAIQRLISDTAATPVSVPAPAQPSLLGYQWPIVGTVTSGYGYRIHPVYGTRKLHSGIDIGAARGTPIAATSGGVVIWSGWRGGYGNTVIVDHGAGLTSLYAHMSQLNVSVGAILDRGDVVGLVGATGTATGNHLHFEIRLSGSAVDPAPYLP